MFPVRKDKLKVIIYKHSLYIILTFNNKEDNYPNHYNDHHYENINTSDSNSTTRSLVANEVDMIHNNNYNNNLIYKKKNFYMIIGTIGIY